MPRQTHLKPALSLACAALLLAGCADSGPEPPPAAAAADSNAPEPRIARPCGQGETIIFACTPEPDLTVALCASADDATLQYRETGDGTAAAWPEEGVPASQAFRSGTLMYSGGGGAFLRFDRDGLVHTVYTGIGRGWEKAGVLVQEDGHAVRELTCNDEVTSTIGPALFERALIPADDAGFEIP